MNFLFAKNGPLTVLINFINSKNNFQICWCFCLFFGIFTFFCWKGFFFSFVQFQFLMFCIRKNGCETWIPQKSQSFLWIWFFNLISINKSCLLTPNIFLYNFFFFIWVWDFFYLINHIFSISFSSSQWRKLLNIFLGFSKQMLFLIFIYIYTVVNFRFYKYTKELTVVNIKILLNIVL